MEVQVMGDGFLDVFEARDISITGAGVLVPHRFEGCNLDGEVDLVVTLPSQRPFLAKGVIVHRTKMDQEFFGISFTSLSGLSRELIEQYVDDRLKDPDSETDL